LTAKCCGETFASSWIGYFLISILLRKCLLALIFIYIVAPIFAYLFNKKTPASKLSRPERRWLILVFSFWVGASTHYILINWDPGVYPPPPMYSPALVALLFETFASSWIGYFLISILLRKCLLALIFIYIVAPIFAYLFNKKTPASKLSRPERRWLILVFSFWVGASTHYILINWDPGVYPPPPMYSPALVALLFEFVGPKLASNRPMLLMSTVGTASVVCFAYAFFNSCFNFTYFYTSVIAIASSFHSMQQQLADRSLGRGDTSEGNVMLPIQSMYHQLALTIIFGHYIWNRDPKAAVPDSLEERYTLLIYRLR
uniref:Acyl_transf_3 domain-containing protein n=1 Tax=Gongylonema pulchrum TaxID=637853 RepID=A0A183DWJ0_9BILA